MGRVGTQAHGRAGRPHTHTQDSLLDWTLLGLGRGLPSPGLVASPPSGCLTKLPLEAPTHCSVHMPIASRPCCPCCAVPALHWSLAHGAGWGGRGQRNFVLLTSIRHNFSGTPSDLRPGLSIRVHCVAGLLTGPALTQPLIILFAAHMKSAPQGSDSGAEPRAKSRRKQVKGVGRARAKRLRQRELP